MQHYNLSFKALGKLIDIPIYCDFNQEHTSLSYKVIVDETISNWLNKNKESNTHILILDVVLVRKKDNKAVFIQDNWSDYRSMKIFDIE